MIWCLIVLIVSPKVLMLQMKILLTSLQFIFSSLVAAVGNFIMSIFGDNNRLKIFIVVVAVPLTMNILQFIIQDTFLKKSDFEITDVEVMRKYYECTSEEELEKSLSRGGNQGTDQNMSIELKPSAPAGELKVKVLPDTHDGELHL